MDRLENVADSARQKMAAFHPEVVGEVKKAIAEHDVVVVGMAVNTHVRRVKAALDAAGIAYHYLEYGGYMSAWRERLAIKLWSGWATFPMVFVKGQLLGGEDLTKAAIADGSLAKAIAADKKK